jgi:hypothetical protein
VKPKPRAEPRTSSTFGVLWRQITITPIRDAMKGPAFNDLADLLRVFVMLVSWVLCAVGALAIVWREPAWLLLGAGVLLFKLAAWRWP